MDVVRIETDRLILDEPANADVPFIFAYCQDQLIQDFTTVPQPYRLRDAENFLTRVVEPGWTSGKELTWALRRRNEPTILGVVSLRDWNDSQAMIGFWLGAPWRGQGYMPEAVAAVCDWAFESEWFADSARPKTTIVWEALIGNPASALVARKVGFRYTGTGSGEVARFGEFAPSHRAELTVSDRPGPAAGWPAEVLSR
ncbi:GNAT family N-acetyltransferase [Mycetocola zhujimingii]|uniref:GNAT family N-acetyltransferase n=1 Tax=Mycetocola zhujimingii TaxID=2079792 RepID=UPI000D38B5DC|nr:GNAT family N-acetyltransferase [Mycetocola zhujimingii]AWB85742.1 N-acetyltransferase [Mycetocola zhujimingii]